MDDSTEIQPETIDPPPVVDEAEAEPTPAAEPVSGRGLRLVSIVRDPGLEPAPSLTEEAALAGWVATTAPWHPALLALSEALPAREDADVPSPHGPTDLRLVAANASMRVPSGYRTGAEDAGSPLVDATPDRSATIALLLARAGASTDWSDEQRSLVPDFLALGAAHGWLIDLAAAMGHADSLDRDALTRETLVGARAWASGDVGAARNRLRAGFEVLTQARERFYPVESYLVDLTLFDPLGRPDELAESLAARAPFTLMTPASAIEAVAARAPDLIASLRTAIDEGWADVIGGAYAETDEPLLPLTSILWGLRKGAEVYRAHLDGRSVETLARRRFALYPQLPQIGRRFGFRFALHLGFDAGRFPIRPELKRLWESPDGSSLETLNRPPVAGERHAEGARLPWRIAKTMKDDYAAALPIVHWAGRRAPWSDDLRKAHGYSPVLGRLTTVNDLFHHTDRPFESFRTDADDYVFPYLDQAIRRGDPAPISARVDHRGLRARLDAATATDALAIALGPSPGEPGGRLDDLLAAEDAIERGRPDEAREPLGRATDGATRALADRLVGDSPSGRPGHLVFNPAGIARRVAVALPGATAGLAPGGPVLAAQTVDGTVLAVVDLPAFGYAWIARDPDPSAGPAPTPGEMVAVKDRTIRNGSMSVAIDPSTGGIRGIHGPNEPTARLGQQVLIVGLGDLEGRSASSAVKLTSYRVDQSGPALVQATTEGDLLHPFDGYKLASFRQTVRLHAGRPALEIEVALSAIDEGWLASVARSEAWAGYLACRWAWPDPESTVRRMGLLHPSPTTVDRPETGESIDLTSRTRRTSLLFGGLAHHRRIRPRMLDTILVVGQERCRTFRLGVAIDLEHPWQAVVDRDTPALVSPTDSGPPRTGPTGWLMSVDHKAVAVLSVRHRADRVDGRGWGLEVTLLETSGRAARCRVRTFRDPSSARQVDFNDETIVDLPTDGDATLIDLTPHELARVDITLGSSDPNP